MRCVYWMLMASLLVACGGAPKTLTDGEDALEAGRLDDAEALLLRAQGSYLTDDEKARVKAGLGIIARRQVAGRTRAAEAEAGWAGYEALAQTRRWYREGGGLPGDLADRDIVRLMIKRAERLWSEVAPLRAAHHYTDAVWKAADVLAPLPKDAAPRLRKRFTALRAEARAWHEAKIKGAQPGAVALHAGLANRFGGTNASPLDDLRAQAVVAIEAAAGGGRCAAEEASVARGAARKGARMATVKVTLTRCGVSETERTGTEQYTYIEEVPYQVRERVKVRDERYVKNAKTCTRKMPGAHMSEGRVVKTMTTTTYDCSTYGERPVYENRLITKYRKEDRTGVRTTRTRNTSASLGGSISVRWDGGSETFTVSASRTAVDTAYASPHGSKGYDADKSTGRLAGHALSAVVDLAVVGVRGRVRAADGKRWRATADAAAKAGKTRQSEHADVRAAVASGLSGAASARLKARYGLSGAQIKAALEATPVIAHTERWFVSPDLRAQVTSARANYEAGEQVLERGWAWGLVETGLRTFGASDIPFQPDRHSASLYMRLNYAFLAHAFDESSWGWVLYDGGMMDFWLGGRTSEAMDYGGSQDEGVLAAGIGLGYQLMWGFRGKLLGLFGGLRTQATFRRAGDFRSGGATHPLVGRMELRLSQRYPIFIEAYGMAPFGTGEITGVEAVFGTGGTTALVLRAERLNIDSVIGGLSSKDDVWLGRHPSWTVDVTYGVQF